MPVSRRRLVGRTWKAFKKEKSRQTLLAFSKLTTTTDEPWLSFAKHHRLQNGVSQNKFVKKRTFSKFCGIFKKASSKMHLLVL